MKKKHYILVGKLPHMIASISEDVEKICEGSKSHVINWFGGPSYIDLGELTYMKSLIVRFKIGRICANHFINSEDVDMVLNQ